MMLLNAQYRTDQNAFGGRDIERGGISVTISTAVDEAAYVEPADDTVLPGYPRPTLSHRECEVVLSWLRSDSKAVVGEQLFISIGTVNTHLARIRSKYAAVGRPAPTKAALFARALQDGLTDLRDW